MASFLARSLRSTARQSFAISSYRSCAVASSNALHDSSSLFVRPCPADSLLRRFSPADSPRGFSTWHTIPFLSESNSNESNHAPKETFLLDRCDFERGGQPFINGQASPRDLKYHQELVRNIGKAKERNKNYARPYNFDRSQILRMRDLQTSNQGPVVGGGLVGNSRGPLGTATLPPLNACNTSMKLPSMGGQRNYGVVPPQIPEKENILRPLSPHLPVYKPQLASTLSIANRISAVYLTSIIVYFHLIYLKLGPICLTHESIYNLVFYSSKLFLISAEISALALAYHIVIGVRHLLADFSGIGGRRGK